MQLLSRFKSLFALAAQHRKKLALSGVCAIAAELMGLVPFVLVAEIGRLFFEGVQDADRILSIAGLALAALLGRYVLLGISKTLSHITAYATMYDLQLRLAQKIGRMPLGQVHGWGSSTLKKAVLQDTDIVHTIIGHYFADFLVGTIIPAATLAMFFYVDWRMGLAAACVLPLLWLAHRMAFSDFKTESDAYFKANDHMQSTLLEYVSGISVIKTYNRDLSQRLKDAVDGQVDQIVRWTNRTLPPWSIFNIMADVSLLFILPVGLGLVAAGLAAPATVLFFLLLGIGYLQPLVRLSIQIGFLNYASKSIERVETILAAPVLESGATSAMPQGNDITLNKVGFYHGDTEALSDVSLSIPEGSLCAIVGPSGAGKTTLAQLLGRFWDVDSGAIKLGGADLRDIAEDELYKRISFVFQDVFLFNGTVADNLRLAKPDATDEELIRACTAARAHDFIMQMPMGYDSPVGLKGGLLSGGQKQRLSIARAILRDAPVLVLDEATAYADPVNEYEIQKALGALMKGRTVIMIAHRLSAIVHADQIVVMDRGRVVTTGTHDKLSTTCDLYGLLWQDYNRANVPAAHEAHYVQGMAA